MTNDLFSEMFLNTHHVSNIDIFSVLEPGYQNKLNHKRKPNIFFSLHEYSENVVVCTFGITRESDKTISHKCHKRNPRVVNKIHTNQLISQQMQFFSV